MVNSFLKNDFNAEDVHHKVHGGHGGSTEKLFLTTKDTKKHEKIFTTTAQRMTNGNGAAT